jgi:ketosteroid isomerase-like protein
MRAAGFVVLLMCAGARFMVGQDSARQDGTTNVLALEHAWNQAEQHKDNKALDLLLDNSLVYTDYDGTLKTKADFLAGMKVATLHPEEQVTESMSGREFGDTVVMTGIYRVKGVSKGKPYLRRGRFTDTWVYRKGNWVCVASQYTLISH